MHSTLEHTQNPLLYITSAFQKLKPGGLLVFSAPNIHSINFYLAKLLKLPYPGFIFEHLYYFNPKVIKKILAEKFEIIEITSYHHSRLLLPPIIEEKKPQKTENKYTLFLRELIQTKQKWLYIRQRLYEFQMRILRELLEFNRTAGKLQLGDIIYIFAKKNE
jgi:SAM-dependent methyltransferase